MEVQSQTIIYQTLQEERLLNLKEVLIHNNHSLQGQHLYKLHFAVQLTLDNIIYNRVQMLNTIAREIINGKKSIGGINNRDWFTNHFSGGGLYEISVHQQSALSFPCIHIHMYCVSNQPHLHNKIQNQLSVRVRKIALYGQASISGGDKIESSEDFIDAVTDDIKQQNHHFFMDSEPMAMTGKAFRQWSLDVASEVRLFGNIHKAVHKRPEDAVLTTITHDALITD